MVDFITSPQIIEVNFGFSRTLFHIMGKNSEGEELEGLIFDQLLIQKIRERFVFNLAFYLKKYKAKMSFIRILLFCLKKK